MDATQSNPVPLARRRRQPKAWVVAEDIARQIQGGALQPGERLASFSELGDSYRVSQGVVTQAMAILSRRGLVTTRHRSGSYVTGGGTSGTAASGRLGAYLRPRPAAVRQLTMYVSELLADNLALWDRVLEQFGAVHRGTAVSVVSCRDGHLAELAAHRHFDLVEATPHVLSKLGSQFVSPGQLAAVGLTEADFLPAVRPLVAGGQLPGIPFLLTVHYLFANATLLQQLDVEAKPFASWQEFYQQAGTIERALRTKDHGRHGLYLGGLVDDLILVGAYRYENGRVVFSRAPALAWFEVVHRAGFEPTAVDLIPDKFVAGEVAYMHHCSYEAVALREQAKFDWRMLPLPAAAGSQPLAHPTVLAMNRAAHHPQACLSLIQHLLSEPVQLEFARQYGNVPVRAHAALDPATVAGHPAGAEAYRRTLELCTPTWPESIVTKLAACSEVETPLSLGEATPAQALARMEFALKLALADQLEIRPE
jgi:DNA-binding transcriptional regulator YhcF (GntR family)